ncbi:low-specificity L-threonine aldolase [Parachitinimonas caeni]|uniref:Low-specificity L-threonine aldolase n=1 Tax=Parachitinimonas caeni TaxID=3031301 RepID=A0ABT7DV61_9NEIS|nr:low-specificity L-threonine aldolase [Parachitinimonas caeni]MDK2123025.1 low-specificity L-threonine aldolase [Parachitinimonas caeni]
MSYPLSNQELVHTPLNGLDFRSDTVTRPGQAMRAAMATAEVGDDVFGDDPTVNALEAEVAEMLGFEAAVFAATGTQSNLLGLLTHCQRGDEYIVGQDAHTYKFEAGGAAVLGSIQPQPLDNAPDGSIPLAKIEAAIKPDDAHFARSRLLALENTIGGKVLPASYIAEAQALARRRGLALHLDGARLWNAAVAQGVSPAAIAQGFDTVSVCLSKGLGAPVGSVLLGSREAIKSARRWRKMLGGTMRQVGIIAAAGRYAIRHHIDRLAEDHANAQRLADGLSQLPGLTVTSPQTNIVFVSVEPTIAERFADHLRAHGVLITGTCNQRWVTHLDVNAESITRALNIAQKFFI